VSRRKTNKPKSRKPKAKKSGKAKKSAPTANRRPIVPPGAEEALLVENFDTGEITAIGGPGMTVYSTAMTLGDIMPVVQKPEAFELVIEVDLPFFLPIPDEPFRVAIHGGHVRVAHRTKRRGQERYSTINARLLPYFSSLQISVRPAFVDTPMPGNDRDPDAPSYFDIIKGVVARIESFLHPLGVTLHERMPTLSYDAFFVELATGRVVAKTEYPYNEIIEIRSPAQRAGVDVDTLRDFLAASIEVAALGESTRDKAAGADSFRQKVFLIVHDFIFYCRQHAEAVKKLPEEMIRDLLLILFKTVFGSAEGEPYHFDGKLDFKVTNPVAKHEFVTGELKWWDGPKTFGELLDQALRKHATGQEAEVFCAVLSDRKDQDAVAAAVVTYMEGEAAIVGGVQPRKLPQGSRERWYESTAEIRSNTVPLNVAIADLYHEKV
jgi:hypothetical protein